MREVFTQDGEHPALIAVDAQVAAWNRGDLEGYLAWVHPDVIYVRADSLLRGIEALRAGYQITYTSAEQMGTLSVEVLDASLGGSVASVVLAWQLSEPGRTIRGGQALVVFVETSQGWRMRHDATLQSAARS